MWILSQFKAIIKSEYFPLFRLHSDYWLLSQSAMSQLPLASCVPCAPRREIISPSASPESGHAKPMGALLSKPLLQLLTLINLMWRSVEGVVWKSSQCHDPVPCCWTEWKSGKPGKRRGMRIWSREGKKIRGDKNKMELGTGEEA